ncbi:MAG: hypothetical protein K6D94_06005 [Clostridiales bacterium]|nr:hypothetical protein [Clostridiales bacterium]
MFKKRFVCLLLAALIVCAFAACGEGGGTAPSAGVTPAQDQTPGDPQAPQGGENAPSAAPAPAPAKLTGKMNIIDLDDRDPSVLRGVAIKGVNTGSYDGINGKESSLTDVRCIFELGEWVEFYPDTDATYGLRVWILKHRDDQEYYNKAEFSDLDPNFANCCDLHYPEDEENPDEWYWGNFYLNMEECGPGYYDFVFTYEGKAIAVLLTRFYGEGEISGMSDAELEALMRE